jgi:hypothetical protein
MVTFQSNKFFKIQFGYKILFFLFFNPLFEKRERRSLNFGGKKRVLIDTDYNYQIDRSWCQQVLFK